MYIKDLMCISPQDTYKDALFKEGVKEYEGTIYVAFEPDYTELIPLRQQRRMSKSMRIGISTGMPLIKKFPDLDGILIGSPNGSFESGISFLYQLVDYEEGTLTPTNFVRSTSNAIAGNLALISKNNNYNITYIDNGTAFESCVLDALMHFEEGKAKRFLIGGVDEMSDYNVCYASGMFKKEEINSGGLLKSGTPGTVCGEGGAMFIVESDPENALAELKDVDMISFPSKEELLEKAKQFLERNNTKAEEIDALMLGFSGDSRSDHWYESLMDDMFPSQAVYSFKNLSGEYCTASSFALWLSVKLLNGKQVPAEAIFRGGQVKHDKILLYNHYYGKQHSFMLICGK